MGSVARIKKRGVVSSASPAMILDPQFSLSAKRKTRMSVPIAPKMPGSAREKLLIPPAILEKRADNRK
jgi:hypothetical protein